MAFKKDMTPWNKGKKYKIEKSKKGNKVVEIQDKPTEEQSVKIEQVEFPVDTLLYFLQYWKKRCVASYDCRHCQHKKICNLAFTEIQKRIKAVQECLNT